MQDAVHLLDLSAAVAMMRPCRRHWLLMLVVQVVGYMGVPYYNTDMVKHPQYITVRNGRGQEMMDSVKGKLEIIPTMSSGDRKPFVLQTVVADDE